MLAGPAILILLTCHMPLAGTDKDIRFDVDFKDDINHALARR